MQRSRMEGATRATNQGNASPSSSPRTIPDHWKLLNVQSWDTRTEGPRCPFGGRCKSLDPGGRGGKGFHTLALMITTSPAHNSRTLIENTISANTNTMVA